MNNEKKYNFCNKCRKKEYCNKKKPTSNCLKGYDGNVHYKSVHQITLGHFLKRGNKNE